MSSVKIEFKDLSKRYKDVLAVSNFSAQVQSCRVTGFLGPNGAGKTTTMKAITGYLETNEGDIEVGGISVNQNPEEVKKFILALYQSQDQENKVKDKKGQKGYTEYFYEHFDEKEKLFWVTKAFQKDKNLYLVSINCGQKFWNGNYMTQFNETFNSFKIKK